MNNTTEDLNSSDKSPEYEFKIIPYDDISDEAKDVILAV